jgi:DNA replication ATP-dependent helicase Dna2
MSQDSPGDLLAHVQLLDEIGLFVRNEHAAQREAMRRLWASPLEERVAEGRCIDRVEFLGMKEGRLARFRCAGNDSRFREGDLVRISRDDPAEPLCEALIVVAGDTELELELRSGLGLAPGADGLCIDESTVDLERLYAEALDEVGWTDHGRSAILPLLAGTKSPTLDARDFEEGFADAEANGLDDRQAEAVASACSTDSCWLIHGPPGTGKTRTLARIAAILVERGERVLLTSFTHRAINNALEAAAGAIGDMRKVAKIAAFPEPGLGLPHFTAFADSPFAGSDEAYLIGATPFSLRSFRLRAVDFDTVIVDEASQVTVPLAVMAMLAGKRFVFAGDHRQLPPVSLTLSPHEATKMSIFGRLEGRGFDTMLSVTHRLNAPLCAWPSTSFYQSRLVPHPAAAERRFRWTSGSGGFAEALGREPAVVWMAVPHRRARTAAMEEVTLVADMLLALAHAGMSWSEVGVVVPFRRQARLLRRNLAAKTRGVPVAHGSLIVDTVDRMQGQERECVFVSFATSDANFAARVQSFLFQPQRLNVAATRPRTKLVLVASPELLAFARSRTDDDDAACFVSLLESAHRIDVALPAPTDESAT